VATETAQPGRLQRVITFYHDVIAEMKKVTWPDWTQIRQLSIGVIALSLFIGGVIAIMDIIFQTVLARGIPNLFRG
jgi:preprotein translocase subunit SecE